MKIEDYPLPESREDRLALIERIWLSLGDSTQSEEISEEVRRFVRARYQAYVANKDDTLPAEEVFERLRKRQVR